MNSKKLVLAGGVGLGLFLFFRGRKPAFKPQPMRLMVKRLSTPAGAATRVKTPTFGDGTAKSYQPTDPNEVMARQNFGTPSSLSGTCFSTKNGRGVGSLS